MTMTLPKKNINPGLLSHVLLTTANFLNLMRLWVKWTQLL